MLVFENFELTNYNSYRVKSICAKAYIIEDVADLTLVFSNEEKKIIIGAGNNLLLKDDYYNESFIIFSEQFSGMILANEEIKAYSGTSLKELSVFALENGLSGLEMFYDIPSSLGGAIVMNAGSSGEEIKDILKDVSFFDTQKNDFFTLDSSMIHFEYRNSFFQNNPHLIITEATLKLNKALKADIKEKMDSIKDRRWSKQPREYPNAGSVFKRPEGKFVGPMIEALNLKGFQIGGAAVSDKHAGFIINKNNAAGKDILNLINFIKEKVFEAYGIELEVEQRII